MVIYILSRNVNLYSTSRIYTEGKKAGHSVKVINHLYCDLMIVNNQYQIYYEGKILPKPDYIIPRIGANVTNFGEKVIRHFEKMGVKTLTSSSGLLISRDKFRCMQYLIEHEISVPTSYFSDDLHEAEKIVKNHLGYPFILKLIEGTQGVGVFLISDEETAQRYFDLYSDSRHKVMLQKFVAESFGRDIRIIVVGNQVVGAMERVAQNNEFRSNIHRGGKGKSIVLSHREQEMAIRICQILKLKIAGVDIIRSKEGPLVLEVNSSPGLEGIEKTTKINIAQTIIKYIEHGN